MKTALFCVLAVGVVAAGAAVGLGEAQGSGASM